MSAWTHDFLHRTFLQRIIHFELGKKIQCKYSTCMYISIPSIKIRAGLSQSGEMLEAAEKATRQYRSLEVILISFIIVVV